MFNIFLINEIISKILMSLIHCNYHQNYLAYDSYKLLLNSILNQNSYLVFHYLYHYQFYSNFHLNLILHVSNYGCISIRASVIIIIFITTSIWIRGNMKFLSIFSNVTTSIWILFHIFNFIVIKIYHIIFHLSFFYFLLLFLLLFLHV